MTTELILTGVVYPLEYLILIRDCTSLAELKVISCVYGYDGIIGIESENLTYSDLLERTGLKSDRSLSDGLTRAIDRQKVKLIEVNGNRYYCPVEKSKAHEHEHESFKDSMSLNQALGDVHEHAEKSKVRQQLYQILLDEFGMSMTPRTLRIAQDLALTPKYPISRLQAQIRYTRYEVQHGENGDPHQVIRNPAGRLVDRIRLNRQMPVGFVLIEALEAEGWQRVQIYQAIFNNELDAPEIENNIGYHTWLIFERGADDD